MQAFLQTANKKFFPQFKIDWDNVNPPAYLILGFTIVGITIINYFFSRDNSAMGTLVNPIDKDIPDRDFKSRFKSVCEELESDLRNIDQKTNWSVQDFVPLDAEVEVITNNSRQRKITDLLGAIRKSKDRTFLVLGDPGSGKSVALRKLCRDLLKEEAKKVYKIPLYINLKEWKLDKKWTFDNPPTVIQLREFVLKNIKGGDISTARFFETYFDRLYETGRLYFIMDSFDEIPAVLDEKDNSELIDQLSNVLYKFLKGARDEKSQGILSSRIFRKPTSSFQTKTTLEIRPFSESKVIQSFKNRLNDAEEFVTTIFKEKRELTSMVRNPFLATLIIDYIKNNNQLPENQSITYNAYLNKTLSDSNVKTKLEAYDLTKEEIFDGAILISKEMFEKTSLEVPINNLRKTFPTLKLDEIINVLKYSRLGRGNERDDNQFSFVHRRFAEYFYVQYLIRNPELVDVQAIPNDSQMRDALVLYCEVGEFIKVKEIANFCWSTIISTNEIKDRKVVHCLRFLVDAFKGRLDCIQHFRKELADYLNNQINPQNDIISIKTVIETVGLLEEQDLDIIVSKALTYNNFWINDVAIKSCRHLNDISLKLENNLCLQISNSGIRLFFQQYRDYEFSFSLSESFRKVLTLIKIRRYGDILLGIIILLFFSIYFFNSFFSMYEISPTTIPSKDNSFDWNSLKYDNLKQVGDYKFSFDFSYVFKAFVCFIFFQQIPNFNFLSKLYTKQKKANDLKPFLRFFYIISFLVLIGPLTHFLRTYELTYYFFMLCISLLFLFICGASFTGFFI